MDYTIFYKDCWNSVDGLRSESWDVLFSGYNTTDRVRAVFNAIPAGTKRWLVHHEYEFTADELPLDGEPFVVQRGQLEVESLQQFFETLPNLRGTRLCIDITGLMRPHILVLLQLLPIHGVQAFDVIYAEPVQYIMREGTVFASGDPTGVRPVEGFAGTHDPTLKTDTSKTDTGRDLLILGVGYEYELVRQVANSKKNARKLQLFGFPPFRPDFYQENRINAQKASEWISKDTELAPLFAPANDPFVTAETLREAISKERAAGIVSSVYLAPLSSRPQTLGFGLYWIYDANKTAPVTVLYPFTPKYSRGTSQGCSRVWRYRIELP